MPNENGPAGPLRGLYRFWETYPVSKKLNSGTPNEKIALTKRFDYDDIVGIFEERKGGD